MTSFKRYDLKVAYDDKDNNRIYEILKSLTYNNKNFTGIDNAISIYGTWWDNDPIWENYEQEMIWLSKQYPNEVFILRYYEYIEDIWKKYFKNGEIIKECDNNSKT